MDENKEQIVRKRRSIFNVYTRESQPPTSYTETLIHLLKANVGPGMFAMGHAFKNGGLFLSLILIPVLAVMCVHCEHLLVAGAEKMRILYEEEHCADYAETVELCFLNGPPKTQSWGKGMRITVNVFLCITQLGFCCVYIVFVAANVHQVLLANNITIDVHYLMVIVFVPILLVCFITKLKLLLPVSFIANLCMLLSLSITIYFTLKDGLPDIDERNHWTDGMKLALFFGIAIFAFEGISLVLPLKNVMRNPSNFETPCGVLNVGLTITTLMYMIAGALGYMKWGENVRGSLTLNVGNSTLAQSVQIIVALGVLLGYPLQFFVAIQIMLSSALKIFCCEEKPLLGELIFRAVLVVVTLIIAEAVPALGLFISLIGAVCSTALALVFPPIIEWILLRESTRSKTYKYFIVFKNIILLIVAFVGFAVGTYITVKEIYEHFVERRTDI